MAALRAGTGGNTFSAQLPSQAQLSFGVRAWAHALGCSEEGRWAPGAMGARPPPSLPGPHSRRLPNKRRKDADSRPLEQHHCWAGRTGFWAQVLGRKGVPQRSPARGGGLRRGEGAAGLWGGPSSVPRNRVSQVLDGQRLEVMKGKKRISKPWRTSF